MADVTPSGKPRSDPADVRLRDDIEHAAAGLGAADRLIAAHRLTGGVSADVFRLEITVSGSAPNYVVFRQHRSDGEVQAQITEVEYRLLAELHRLGVPVPEPLLLHPGDAGAGPYLVVAWVDGTTEVARHEVSGALDQMAQTLADVHGIDPAALRDAGLQPIEDPLTAAPAYLPDDPTGHQAAAALAGLPPGWQGNQPSPLHGDYWPGNILWQTGQLTAVIDWEDATIGDPMADLATARVELACAYGTDAADTFTERYVAATAALGHRVALDSLPVWEVYASAASLASMHEWGLAPDDERHRRAWTRRSFEQATERLVRLAGS